MDLLRRRCSSPTCRGRAARAEPRASARRSAGSPPRLPASAGGTRRSTPTGCSTGSSSSPATPAGLAGDFDLFHVVDHTYAQLVHALPADRTGVYCHDLDAFRCLLEPAADPRPRWFRALARRILTGMQKAAVVFHNSAPDRRASWSGSG